MRLDITLEGLKTLRPTDKKLSGRRSVVWFG